MATNSLQSLHHHHHHQHQHQHHSILRLLPIESPPTTLFLKPTTPTTTSLSQSISFTPLSLSSTTATPSTTQTDPLSFDLLQHHLSTQDFRQADEETRRLLIALAGEPAQNRGYVFFSEVQFISQNPLKTIDNLWKTHSNNLFGYSVQRKIWKKANRDFTVFFMKVGWMKKLETEVLQYNYRAFPDEFIWELGEKTPEGHLPLTNALRGTQLLNSILNHPAFDDAKEDEEEQEEEVGEERESGGLLKGLGVGNRKSLSSRGNGEFKPDYSF